MGHRSYAETACACRREAKRSDNRGRAMLMLEEAWRRTTDNGTRSLQGTDEQGRGLLLVFDMYVVEQLSVFKRLRHALRMFKAAITGNVNVSSGVRVVVIK